MNDWMLYKDSNPDIMNVENAIKALTNALPDFYKQWEKYLDENYKDYPKERLDYVDISEHARFVRDSILSNNLKDFDEFFNTIEFILNHCDSIVKDFMVAGLIESIQNTCSGAKINIWTGFDRWLKPTTKMHWDNQIFTWEGKDAIEKYKTLNPGNNKLIN
jgi:hypothetical protein